MRSPITAHLPDATPDRPRIAMALFGDLTFDSRVRKEARSLAEAGYGVTIVCLASSGPDDDLPPNVTVLVRQPVGAAVIPGTANPFATAVAGRIGKAGQRARWLVEYARGLRTWGRLAVQAAGPVNVWHAHDLTGLAAIARVVPHRIPVVYDSHELFLESGTATRLPGLARQALRRYESRLVSRAAAVITVNDEISAVLRRRYHPRSIAVVHNCPSLPETQPASPLIRDAAGIPAASPVVLYHGGMTPGRGIDLLLEALAQDGLQGVHLALMGYGPLVADLQELARTERWRDRLHVLGPVPPSSLLAWVSSADVGAMVNPGGTLNDVYSSPNKLFECIAAGTPVVASDLPAIRRIVIDNQSGPLGAVCDPGSVDSIAEAVRSILRLEPSEVESMRARCRVAARERWNWEAEARTLLSVYAGLDLGESQSSPTDRLPLSDA